jgi:hypothetical protein
MREEDALSSFEAPVAINGYEWRETVYGPALAPRPSEGKPRIYRPFSKQYAALFQEFASLAFTQEAILLFANRYGLLGPPVTLAFHNGEYTPIGDEGELFADGAVPPESDLRRFGIWTSSWTTQIGRMAWVLSAAKNQAAGRSIWFNEAETARGFRDEDERGRRARVAADRTSLAEKLTLALGAVVRPRVEYRRGRFSLQIAPASLIGCLWLQAARALAQPKRFRKCAGPDCKNVIELSLDPVTGARVDAQFCGNACKNRDYRRRQNRARALAGRGQPLSTIAKAVRSDPATVKRWLAVQ